MSSKVCMCVNTGHKVKEQEDVSSQIHTIARDSRIIYYYRDEYGEREWRRSFGSGSGSGGASFTYTHTHTHTDK